jgi:hypothetical protein
METIFEKLGGTCRQEGDYLLPNVDVPESPKIGIWGERRRRYLREHEKATYTAMLLSGELNAHLEEVDRSASEMFDRLVAQIAEQEGITEQLKTANQMEWVQRTNNIRNRVIEIVSATLICKMGSPPAIG